MAPNIPRGSPPRVTSTNEYHIGQRVRAKWKDIFGTGNNKLYGAKIIEVKPNGSIVVVWDEDGAQSTIPQSKVESQAGSPRSPDFLKRVRRSGSDVAIPTPPKGRSMARGGNLREMWCRSPFGSVTYSQNQRSRSARPLRRLRDSGPTNINIEFGAATGDTIELHKLTHGLSPSGEHKEILKLVGNTIGRSGYGTQAAYLKAVVVVAVRASNGMMRSGAIIRPLDGTAVPTLEIYGLGVDERCRRRGFGRLTWAYILRWATTRKRVYDRIILDALDLRAKKFWTQMGFCVSKAARPEKFPMPMTYHTGRSLGTTDFSLEGAIQNIQNPTVSKKRKRSKTARKERKQSTLKRVKRIPRRRVQKK